MPQVQTLPALSAVSDDDVFVTVDSPTSGAVAKIVTAATARAYFNAPSGARVYRNTTQTVANTTLTTMSYTTERWDTDNYWSAGAPTRLTIPTAGTYLFGASVELANTTAQRTRYADLLLNGTTIITEHSGSGFAVSANTSDTVILSASVAWECQAGDYVEVRVYQNSTASLSTTAGTATSANLNEFYVERLSGGSTANTAGLGFYNVRDYGAKGDVKQLADGVTVVGTTFTSATAAFTAGDTGKTISIGAAGTAGIVHTTTITYVNATTVTLASGAAVAGSGRTFRYGTDDQAACQAAMDAANTAGRGVVFYPAGIYGHKTSVTHKLNVVVRGAAREVAQVWALADNVRIFEDPNAGTAVGTFQGMEDLTLRGMADLYPVQGGDTARLSVMRAERIWWRNVHGIYGRQMGMTGIGTYECRFENCTIEKTLRDGLNATGSYSMIAIGNTCTEIADDGIAFHISAAYALGTIINPQAIVIGNRFHKSGGVKCLGATNNIIANNSGRFLNGYGVFLDADTTFNEGYKDQLGVIVSNNSFIDILNLNYYSGISQDVCYGLWIAGTGLDGNYGVANPGTGTAANKGQTNDAWDKTGSPSTGTYSFIISNNVCHQALESTANTTFSAYGFGNAWWTSGSADLSPFYGTIARTGSSSHVQGGSGSKGIKLAGGVTRDILVTGNKVYGFFQGIDHEFLTSTYNNRAHYRHNEILRCVEGVRYYTTANIFGEFIWEGNYFDLDPIFEAAERTTATSQPTGTWTIASAGSSARGFTTTGSAGVTSGLQIRGNTFKNVAQITSRTSGEGVMFDGNYLILDPVATSPSFGGVNVTDAELFSSTVISTVCDPRLTTYDRMRTDSNDRARSSIPSAGVWAKGTFVRNTAMAIGTPSAGKILAGWMRMTSGSGNVAATDWHLVVWANT